ncbi:NADH-quinone oxidoreductase subunit L [Chloroflexota bacterium]
MPYELIWLIFLLPVFSFVIISFFVRPFVKKESRVAGYITITAITGSLVLSLWTLTQVMASPHHELPLPDISWLAVGNLNIHLGLMVDSLTAVMLVAVTIVSLMVQIYSQGYMHGDPGYHRYYAWMSLFTASMLGLVLADNLLLIFVFWELVGLCSYLLIGFWFHRPTAANAAKKAFIVTRLGDFGFLAAILLLFARTGTFDIAELHSLAITGVLAGTTLTWAAIGIFAGAAGKSAQFPLHVWLPDAMEGPTPVSALIHSATMVSAGVFLVARTFPIFAPSIEAVTIVAIIGGFTAIFAASMGLVANDIKRVLAYSTISQLGYMMLGLGAAGIGIAYGGHITLEAAKAAIAIGIFHLFNHAFFKALLFLGAGSVNHATGTFDMRLMGGLRKVMPWTYITFVIGSMSLAGIWPLAGFWSKDEIVAIALQQQPILGSLALITVFMTAFYMFRVVFITFGGEYRGGSPEAHGYPHESPPVMVTPMVVLAILAIVSGFWNITGDFGALMGHGETYSFAQGFFGILTHSLPWISLMLAGLGILLAYVIYSAKWLSAERIGSIFKPLYTLFLRKYWMDELYENVIVRIVLLRGLFSGLEKVDTYGIDGIVNGVANGVYAGGKAIRRAQTGQLQLYGLVIGTGILAIIIILYLFG